MAAYRCYAGSGGAVLALQPGAMFKRTKEKKLAVKKETLRHLQGDQLAQVVGGAPRGTSRCHPEDTDDVGKIPH